MIVLYLCTYLDVLCIRWLYFQRGEDSGRTEWKGISIGLGGKAEKCPKRKGDGRRKSKSCFTCVCYVYVFGFMIHKIFSNSWTALMHTHTCSCVCTHTHIRNCFMLLDILFLQHCLLCCCWYWFYQVVAVWFICGNGTFIMLCINPVVS